MKKTISVMLALLIAATLFTLPLPAAAYDVAFDEAANVLGGTLSIVNDAEHPWKVAMDTAGKYCISSDIAGLHGVSSAVTLTEEFSENSGIKFEWRTSSENKWDSLSFSVDGVELVSISGEQPWETKVIALSAGAHTLEWKYSKDASYSMYGDCGLVDEIETVTVSSDANNIDDSLNSRSSELNFENDPANPWTAVVSGGTNTAKSTIEGKNDTSTAITLRQHMTAGQAIYYTWKTDCESVWDRLVFTVNGVEAASVSGVNELASKSYEITADGDYVFQWIYIKDTLNSFGADCAQLGNIRIGEALRVTGIIIGRSASIGVGSSLRIASSVRPSGACNRDITWESSDEAIATVDGEGTVTGVSAGVATITATTVEGGFTGTCTVTIGDFQPTRTYYVNNAGGNDSANGNSVSTPLKTLAGAIALMERSNTPSATIVMLKSEALSAPVSVSERKVNIKTSGNTVSVTRAAGYTGELFRVLLDGALYLGETTSSEGADKTLIIGGGAADSPAIFVDCGELYMYHNVGIEGNAASVSGAGVYLNEGSFVMVGGEIKGNSSARYGGGVYNAGGSLVLAGGSVTANSAELDAGGVFLADGSLFDIDDGVVSGNDTLQGENPDVNYPAPPPEPLEMTAFRSDSDSAAPNAWMLFDKNSPAQTTDIVTPEAPVAAAERLGKYIYGYTEDSRFFRILVDAEGSLVTPPLWNTKYIGEAQTLSVLDMTYNYADGVMYALTTDEENNRSIASVSLDSGELTVISDTRYIITDYPGDEFPEPLMTLACDSEGVFYGMSAGADSALWRIDRMGEAAYVMQLGVEAFYLQSAAFDRESGVLYWAQCGESGCGLYAIENGEVQSLGKVGGENTELTGLIIPYTPDTKSESVSADGRYKYRRLADGGITITGINIYNGAGDANFPLFGIDAFAVDLPDEIDGMTVFAVADNAFRETAAGTPGTPRLGGISLPETIGSIGYCAFRDCAALTSVTFGGNESSLGEYAFYNCTALTEITLPLSVSSVGYGAFAGCSSLRKAVLPSIDATYGDYVFYQTSADMEIHGYYPSTAYNYSVRSSISFVDILPYTAPVVSGAEDGGRYNTFELTEGIAISWESPYETTATLDGTAYVAGTPLTEAGEYEFVVSDGRTTVTMNFEIYYENTDYMLGDMDGDEEITVSDALIALRIAARLATQTDESLRTGDVDGDGSISVADALMILRVAARLVAGF